MKSASGAAEGLADLKSTAQKQTRTQFLGKKGLPRVLWVVAFKPSH